MEPSIGDAMNLLDRLRLKRTEPSAHVPDVGRPVQGDTGGGPAGGETFLMPIEDVFTVTGRGTVVTGRISRGSVRPGDEVELVRDRRIPAVVEAVECFRKLLDVAHAGDNVGVLLGGVDRAAVQAGMVLVAAGTSAAPPAETAPAGLAITVRQQRPTPLMEAVQAQDIEAVRARIAAGDDLEERDLYGQTALHWAAKDASTQVVELLLQAGAVPTTLDDDGESPLQAATIKGLTRNVELLRAAQPDPQADPDQPPADPLLRSQTSQVELRLREAGPTTLHGCERILAVVVMHERPVRTVEPGDSPGAPIFGLTPQRIAHGFVEDYKRPGWVPGELRVDDHTAITVLQRPETGQLATGAANALLAATIAASVPDADLSTCAAISFSGENDVFGHTRLAILATSTVRRPAEGKSEGPGDNRVERSAPGAMDAGGSWGLRAAAASERNALVDARQVGREDLGEFKVYRVMAPSGETLADDDRLSIRGQLTCPTCGTKMSQRVVIDFQGFLRAGSSHYTACPNCEGLLRVTGTTTAVDGEAVRWLLLHREAGPAGVGPLPGTDDQLPHFDADVVEIVARGTGQGE